MSSVPANEVVYGMDVRFDENSMTVDLSDGRVLSVPLAWFPRLFDATPEQRADYRFIGRGYGIHWPQIDEDISIRGLLEGRGDMTAEDNGRL